MKPIKEELKPEIRHLGSSIGNCTQEDCYFCIRDARVLMGLLNAFVATTKPEGEE